MIKLAPKKTLIFLLKVNFLITFASHTTGKTLISSR